MMSKTVLVGEREVLELVRGLTRTELRRWVARGWVAQPREDVPGAFRAIDVARVRLIHEMRREMRLNEEAIPVVLSLLDQVYGLRNEMRRLAALLGAPDRADADADAPPRPGPRRGRRQP
jgi:chaperone modulatory protein CbpM